MLTRTLLVLCWLPTLMNFGNKQYGIRIRNANTDQERRPVGGKAVRSRGANFRRRVWTVESLERLRRGDWGSSKGENAMPRVRDS